MPSAKTMVAPAGSFTAVWAVVVNLTPRRVRVLVALSQRESAVSVLYWLSSAMAAVPFCTVKSAVSVAAAGSANTATGTSDSTMQSASRIAVSFDLCILFSIFSHSFLIFRYIGTVCNRIFPQKASRLFSGGAHSVSASGQR